MNKLLPLLVLLVAGCYMSSCGVYRRITGRKAKPAVSDSALVTVRDSMLITVDTSVTAVAVPDATPVIGVTTDSSLLAALIPRWTDTMVWNTFSGKAKAHFEGGGENQDFNVSVRMERGRSIWFSVTAILNFEVARMLITPDSIQIINRLQKEVTAIPFSESRRLLPADVDFSTLQQLLIGDVIQTGHLPNEALDTGSTLVVGYLSPDFSQRLQFDKADTSMQFQAIAKGSSFMLSEYANRTAVAGRDFANNRTISLSDKGVEYLIQLEFDKLAFDEALETPFSIPEKYTRK